MSLYFILVIGLRCDKYECRMIFFIGFFTMSTLFLVIESVLETCSYQRQSTKIGVIITRHTSFKCELKCGRCVIWTTTCYCRRGFYKSGRIQSNYDYWTAIYYCCLYFKNSPNVFFFFQIVQIFSWLLVSYSFCAIKAEEALPVWHILYRSVCGYNY